jgi:mutator protein MutT
MGSSALILYDEEGKILLQLRTAYKKRFASHWGLFGGHIDEGETPEDALLREIKEELGYETRNASKFKVSPPPESPLHLYFERYDTSQTLCPDPSECQEARWFSFEEIRALEPMIAADKRDVLEFETHLRKILSKGK